MATRKDLATLKEARNGDPHAQFVLGRRYISGDNGLSKSKTAAYHWLSKAAAQGHKDACILIAEHFSYTTFLNVADMQVLVWLKCAFDNGIRSAGITFTRLVLEAEGENWTFNNSDTLVMEALSILEELVLEGNAEAKWLLFKHRAVETQLKNSNEFDTYEQCKVSRSGHPAQEWLTQAAVAGVEAAQLTLLDRLWEEQALEEFIRRAESLIASAVQQFSRVRMQYFGKFIPHLKIPEQLLTVLMRSALVLERLSNADIGRLRSILEIAAMAGEQRALLQLGLLHARLDSAGNRLELDEVAVDYEKALFCLSCDLLDAYPEAYYALHLIQREGNLRLHDPSAGRNYLLRAAELGHAQAQFELGQLVWLSRKPESDVDVNAFYWWQNAKARGHKGAEDLIYRYGTRAEPAEWAITARAQFMATSANKAHPFLFARLEVAATFGLNKSEALSIDIKSADRGHCLLISPNSLYPRGKRRLIPIDNSEQRALLDRAGRLFGNIDCGAGGPEGSYRARQERLLRLLRVK